MATFSNDNEEDKDVAKKVTSALERVTSDYHSGSSSDEESIRTSPLTVLNSRCPYQVCHDTIYCLFMVWGIIYGDMGCNSLSRSWWQIVLISFLLLRWWIQLLLCGILRRWSQGRVTRRLGLSTVSGLTAEPPTRQGIIFGSPPVIEEGLDTGTQIQIWHIVTVKNHGVTCSHWTLKLKKV